MTERVFVGIGSNIEPLIHIPRALGELASAFSPLIRSTAYRNPAVGFAGPDFINLVVGFDTERDPFQVVDILKEIESRHGGPTPRPLDLDLLLYGARIIHQGPVRVPRPDITRHSFVLAPLAQIAPELLHPRLGRTLAQLWADFEQTGRLIPVELPAPPDP